MREGRGERGREDGCARDFVFGAFGFEEDKWERGQNSERQGGEDRMKIGAMEGQVGGGAEVHAKEVYVGDHARDDDPVAIELMRTAAAHIDSLAARLIALGVPQLALVGGFAAALQPWLAPQTTSLLIRPAGDAVQGALTLARAAAEALQDVA